MKKINVLLILLLFTNLVQASTQNDSTFIETKIVLETKTGQIFGTLTTPKMFKKIPVALIIGGSGPTDRDGNNPMMKNNSLKILALELSQNGIATVRYDKRGVAESVGAAKSESDLIFNDYINDAAEWVTLLKHDKRFSEVVIIGHSEGSLIGMIGSKNADKFVSIAGPGRSIDKVIKEQLASQPKQVQDLSFPIIDSLKMGKLVKDVNPMLNSLFRPSVQPYMISWFQYDPAIEIGKLPIPSLILQGTNDIQVSVEDAKILASANPKAKLILIDKMNHIFRIVNGDRQANITTYSNATLPIAAELTKNVVEFINH